MKTARINIVSRFLVALFLTALALPAWAAPQVKRPNMFGNIAIVTQETNVYASLIMTTAHVATFNSPVTAMKLVATWCGTPAADNPCLIKILPGVYDLAGGSLTMQPFVDIEGSGEITTIITSTFANSANAGVVNGSDNAEIRFLTVTNTGPGGNSYASAIANNASSPKITHVTAVSTCSGFGCAGVYNSGSSPIMTNVTVTATGGAETAGVYNTASSSPVMRQVTATASATGSSLDAYGVYNSSSSPIMDDVTATAKNGHFLYGVYNTASSPTMSNVTANATSGVTDYGVYNTNSSSPTMNNVTVTSAGGTVVYGVGNSDSSPTMKNVIVFATGGSGNTAVYNSGSSAPTLSNVTATARGALSSGMSNTINSTGTILVDRSTFDGTTSVSNASGVTLKIGASKLVGTVSNSGNLTCADSYNGNYAALGANCQ